ncbi:MAG: hypothetical protein MZV63_47355 [Marinilabiliales bacterium]|nr:hypothetical protein [Marinilabiliales bacterium]
MVFVILLNIEIDRAVDLIGIAFAYQPLGQLLLLDDMARLPGALSTAAGC